MNSDSKSIEVFATLEDAINHFTQDYPQGYDGLTVMQRIEAEERMIYLQELREISIPGLDDIIG